MLPVVDIVMNYIFIISASISISLVNTGFIASKDLWGREIPSELTKNIKLNRKRRLLIGISSAYKEDKIEMEFVIGQIIIRFFTTIFVVAALFIKLDVKILFTCYYVVPFIGYISCTIYRFKKDDFKKTNKEKIIEEMEAVFKEIPFGIEHTLKVLRNAEDIMIGERIKKEEHELITIIAILHDIGAVEAQKKYGSMDGVYQEKEGPQVARDILTKVGYTKYIDRICFIIGNHHTPSKIDGIDFQIQWEADLLENLATMNIQNEQQEIKKCIEQNFKTQTGKSIAYKRFVLE